VGFSTLGEEGWWWCSVVEGGGERRGFAFFHCERVGEERSKGRKVERERDEVLEVKEKVVVGRILGV
jgi:hypothetical protein